MQRDGSESSEASTTKIAARFVAEDLGEIAIVEERIIVGVDRPRIVGSESVATRLEASTLKVYHMAR